MELYKEILIDILEKSEIRIADLDKIIEKRCYKALEEIATIVRNSKFDDPECFLRVENIITVLEKAGIGCDIRHDF